MRLFDRFATENEWGRAISKTKAFNEIVLLDVVNIKNLYRLRKDNGHIWTMADWPFTTSPWRSVWVTAMIGEGHEWGCLVDALTEKEEAKKAVYVCLKLDESRRSKINELLDMPNAQLQIKRHYFFDHYGLSRRFFEHEVWSIVAGGGEVLQELDFTPSQYKDTAHGRKHQYLWEHTREQAIEQDEVLKLAFTYANCRNIARHPVQQPEAAEAKKRRRWKTAENKEYTLQISKTQYANDSERKDPQGIMPEHLCRGHFAHYTEEKKLFGKYTGRFWHPPHMRGKKENGTIKKDYSIPS